MVKRLLLFSLIATGLLSLVIYSQWRSKPNYVSGVIETDEIRLGSRVGGRVKSVFVSEGDTIASGQALVEFEAYDLNERLQQALAAVAEREAALKQLDRGLRSEEIAQAKSRFDRASAELELVKAGPREEEIVAAESRVKAAKAEQKLSQTEYERVADLYQSQAIAKSEFDRAKQRQDAAIAQLVVRENELEILKSGARDEEIAIATARVEDARLGWELAKLGSRDELIEQATAALNSAKAAVEVIRNQQKELTIVAPDNGYVDAIDLQPGDLVAPNAPVVTVLSPQNLWVRAYVPQRFMQLKQGQRLRVRIDSLPDQNVYGTISFISNQAEFTPSNVQTPDDRAKQVYRIRVSLGNNEDIRPGMTANVWLDPVDDSR